MAFAKNARPPRAARRGWTESDWVIALSGAALLLTAGLIVYGLLLLFEFGGPIAPRVTVAGQPVGGLMLKPAAEQVDTYWNQNRAILLVGEGTERSVLPQELGISVDPEATVQLAWEVGRGEDRWPERIDLLTAGDAPRMVIPVVRFDPEVARQGLAALAPELAVPAQNARVVFRDGRWTAEPGQDGRALDVDATLAALEAQPVVALVTARLEAVFQPVPPAVSDVSDLVAELEARRNTPLLIHGYDPVSDEWLEWKVEPETFSDWLQVEADEEGRPRMTLDPAGVQRYLESLQPSLSGRSFTQVEGLDRVSENWQAGVPIRTVLRRPPTSYQVQPGDTLLKIAWREGMPYWMILQANSGLDPENLTVGQTLTIPSKTDLLPLPVVWNKRIVISIGQQRLWTYENGQPRSEHVISTGIDRSPTQPGVFQVQSHDLEAYASVWDLYMPHFIGIYEAWPGFMNGIHGLPTLSNGQRLWAGNLGRPASYGCIIMTLSEAEDLYYWAEAGTVVEIRE